MEKRILVIFAHPDDESFGPSGTLHHYAKAGTRIHLLTATKGEAGKNALDSSNELGKIREKELEQAAKVIGIEKVEFMGYIDKTLQDLERYRPIGKILNYIKQFKPQIIISFGPTGISQHPDHIAVHHWVTEAFRRSNYPSKLYYYTLSQGFFDRRYPEKKVRDGSITTIIDVSKYKQIKKKAALCHRSQRISIEKLFKFAGGARPIPTREHFILAKHKLDYQPDTLEDDLFKGLTLKRRGEFN